MYKYVIAVLLLAGIGFSALTEGIYIDSSSTYPSSLSSDSKSAILQVDLIDKGTADYYAITATAVFQDPFTAVTGTATLGEITPQDKNTVSFKFDVSDATPGVYSIPITISARRGVTGAIETVTRYANVIVSTEEALEFVGITAEPADIPVDGNFSIVFDIKNTGSLTVSDITATVETNSTSYIQWVPQSKKIGVISPDGHETVEFAGRTSYKTGPGAYKGTITLIYADGSSTNDFILEVHGAPELKIAGITTDETIEQGKKISLSLQLENIGTGDAKSAKAYLVSDGLVGSNESYIGTVEVDDTGTAIFDIILSKAGSNEFSVKLAYESTSGQEMGTDSAFTLFCHAAPFNGTYIMLVIILIALAFFYYTKKMKRIKLINMVRK
ncbi:MAG: CARDB domain-containing protein [Candidatus Micrarchaeota archaeon]